jgi:replicative DNA helicase
MVLFVHRPEYYHIFQDDKGRDLHGMAEIIIAKHRKGATGDVLLNFRGEFTRFENPEEGHINSGAGAPSDNQGPFLESKINGNEGPAPLPDGYDPFSSGPGGAPMPF